MNAPTPEALTVTVKAYDVTADHDGRVRVTVLLEPDGTWIVTGTAPEPYGRFLRRGGYADAERALAFAAAAAREMCLVYREADAFRWKHQRVVELFDDETEETT